MARLVNQLPRMRVLVVDEDDSLRCVVRDLLIEIGCEVSFVACDVAVRIARDRSPDLDLILLDLDPSAVLGVRDRLAAVLPRMPIAWVSDGNYESTVETAFAVLAAARRHRAKSEERTTARIRRLERTNDDLKRIVSIDQLTGVSNRRHFDELLRTEVRRATRDGSQLSLVMLDLDDFHALNERYGHLGGDDCLRRVAAAMSLCLRRPSDVIARYGGEEFVALLPDTDATGAYVVAERLRAHVEQLQLPHEASRCATVVTLSAGAATSTPSSNRRAETLVAAADVALFRAKLEGRNRICVDAPTRSASGVARQPLLRAES